MNEHRGLWRGKCIDNGDNEKWVEGVYNCVDNSIITFETLSTGAIVETGIFYVDPSTLGRCSEIPDKNDKSIFEGDRVCVLMHNSTLSSTTNMAGTVIWEKGAFSVVWDNDLYGKHFLGYLENVEVIGNIHDGSV